MLLESELILNPDGSIYHLHLRPEQLAPIVFTVGDPERVGQVSRHFDRIEHRVRRREFVTHTGWLGGQRLSVISTGIGPDNIDIVLNELDALVSFDLKTRQLRETPDRLTIIRLGTSGSIRHDIPVDSLVVSAGAFGLDGVLHFYDAPALWQNDWVAALEKHAAAQGHDFPAKPYFASADADLLRLFSSDFRPGITATNVGFYAPQARQLRAPVRQPNYLSFLQTFDFQGHKITNLEMETAAILGFAHLLGHRAVSLNAILANRADGTFSRNPARTVRRMIERALEKIVGVSP